MPQAERFARAGAELKKLRESKGLSQEAISFDANVHVDQSTLSKVERQGPHMVSWAKLIAIAKALECEIEVNFVPKP